MILIKTLYFALIPVVVNQYLCNYKRKYIGNTVTQEDVNKKRLNTP